MRPRPVNAMASASATWAGRGNSASESSRWIECWRSERGMLARVSMTPAPRTWIPPGPDSRTAKPVPTRPGSTPTTRAGRPPDGRSDRDGLHDLVRDVVVAVDRLDVVQFLQCLDEAQHLGGVLALHAHRGL